MPIRTVVDRGRSKSSPVPPASGFAARPWHRETEAPEADAAAALPPLRPVQRLAPVFASQERAAEAESVRAAARSGLRTPGAALPFAAQIRRAFQPHDLSGVRAHVGPAATASADDMQAEAYAAGEHVVFRGRPDLRTVAHEVAHVVQQRAGARPEGGIGRPGDTYERQADGAARAVEGGRPAAGLPPALPPSRGPGPAPVQRIVRPERGLGGRKGFVTTLEDQPRKLYRTMAQARAREQEILASQISTAKVSKRRNKFMGSTAAQQVAPRKGVSKSPNVDYPPKPAELVPRAVRKELAAYQRSKMGLPVRRALIAHASARGAAARTAQDDAMIASPAQNMVDANISMNHKLADSSVAALLYALWAKIQSLGGSDQLTAAQVAAIKAFVTAMAGSPAEARVAYQTLMKAGDEGTVRKATAFLRSGIDILSMSVKNLRFGQADVNTLILYAFDPNQDSSGADTPFTDRIRSAVKGLANAGLVPGPVADAALSQAIDKATGTAMASSSVS